MPPRRRLDISSLLCPADPPHSPADPPAVTEPVVLAPHLRNPALAHGPSPSPSPSADLPRPHADLFRPQPPPRSIDNLIHPPSQPPRHLHLDSPCVQSRPPSSSSSSLTARSPAGGYAFPPVLSPAVSPLSGLGGYSSPRSPLLHRPSSSHVSRHSVPHRPRSNTNPYPLPPPSPRNGKMAFEALVHAATEERKKLSAGNSPDLVPPPVSPLFNRSLPSPSQREYPQPRHHEPDPTRSSSYLRLSRPQYEEEYRRQELQLMEQRRIERLRDDELRERRLHEHQRHLESQELDRQRLLEQQRLEKERLLAQQILVEKLERQREQQRLQGEQEQLRRDEEYQRRRAQEDRLRQELERQRREEIEMAEERRALEEANQRRLEERRRFEEEQRQRSEERRLYEERLAAEERRREELLRAEELRHREERHTEDHLKRREEEQRRAEEQRRREEEYRLREEHLRRAEQERLIQARLRAEHDQRPLLTRVYPDTPLSDLHRFSLSPSSARPLVARSPPAVIELPQSHHPHLPLPGPRKFDPIQIKHSPNRDTPDGEPPLKRQKYSESPPSSLTRHVYPTIVTLPPPISDDQSHHRHASSAVRRSGSEQGKKLGLNDATEREKDEEKERDRPIDGHRIISPLGRRSPPGSQIGRATAAKKSDEARRADEAAAAAAMADVLKTDETHAPVKKIDDIVRPSFHTESTKVLQEHTPIASETQLQDSLPSRPRDDVSNKMSLDTVMNDQADANVKKEPLPMTTFDLLSQSREPQKVSTPEPASVDNSNKSVHSRSSDHNSVVINTSSHPQESCEGRNMKESLGRREDVHEWLPDHYAKSPSTSQPLLKPSRSRSPSVRPVVPKPQPEENLHTPLLDVPKPVIALRSVSPDADAALERELAELMAEEDEAIPIHKHEPDDMDIDLAVAETLEDEKPKVSPMEVDGTDDGADEVENELLSLVDDRPPSTTISSRKAAAPTPLPVPKPPLVKTNVEEGKRPSPTSTTSPIIRPPSTRPGSDRESMPPPSAATAQKEKDEEATRKGDISTTSAQAAKKKKDAGSKVSAKSKSTNSAATNAQAVTSNKQQKTKAAATKKAKGVDTVTTNGISTTTASAADVKTAPRHGKLAGIKKVAGNSLAASRSRSASVMPAGSVDHETEEKDDDEKEELDDDKLYCVCKTKYDEDRFMIACDRCDEWYHTTCVNMPDLEVELVDQFFCPPCLERNPDSSLKTTYKQRCLNGLRHPDPDSAKACHKPARGAISKYCSDECGLKYMQSRIDAWAKKGGKKEELWESVKHAEKREGIVVCVDERVTSDWDKKKKPTKIDRETERLQGLLNQVVKMREDVQGSMEMVAWRERLLQLASERAEQIDQCGWDQRLCFGEEEWQDFGPDVLESYDDAKAVKDENGMQVDETEEEGEWWCPGQKSCKRHNGWQTLRYKDICKEREKKQELLTKLTTRERQLRKRIEELVEPGGRKANERTSQASLKTSKIKMSNGHARSKGTADTVKKGKKRKAPAS